MTQFISAAVIVLVVLGFSPDVQAVPSFSWIEPWNVTLLSNTNRFGTPLGERAFGASATHDGQILDVASVQP